MDADGLQIKNKITEEVILYVLILNISTFVMESPMSHQDKFNICLRKRFEVIEVEFKDL